MQKRYSEYKDSGVQWLGEIPGHWKVMRQKRAIKLINGRAFKDSEFEEDGKYKIVRVGNLFTNPEWYTSSLELEPDKYCKDGDLLYAWSMSYSPFIWHGEKSIFHYHIWNTKLSNFVIKKFVFYYFIELTRAIRAEEHATTMGFITMEVMNKSHIPVPPLSEQEAIVEYLDGKCGMLDKLVEAKEKKIELLGEMKQRLISDAVTRGLNPNVKFKSTNIPWLPQVPEHWDEKRMSSMFTGDVNINKEFEYKKAFKFYYGTLIPKNEIGDIEEYREVYTKYSIVEQGDILVNGLNLNYDFNSQRIACAPNKGIITSAYVVCRPRQDVNFEYFTFLFKAMDSMKLFHGMGTGIRLTLSFKELKRQLLPVPPLSEQREIVAYIASRTEKIDTLVAKLKAEIEHIKEYKQRLISDVVTGQIKVC